ITMIFGFGLVAKIVLAWTIVFFIVFFNTFQGARSVDADLIHSARFLGASEHQVMRTVIIPSALAWTFASLTPSISFALIGVVVGEFLGGESGGGLGYLIIQSLGTLNATDLMVALVLGFLHYRTRVSAGREQAALVFVGGQLAWLAIVLVQNGLFGTPK